MLRFTLGVETDRSHLSVIMISFDLRTLPDVVYVGKQTMAGVTRLGLWKKRFESGYQKNVFILIGRHIGYF